MGTVIFSNPTTVSQLKNSVGLRLIQNNFADSIDFYYSRWSIIEVLNNRYYDNQPNTYNLEENILNAFDFLDSCIYNDVKDNQDIIPKKVFVQINYALLGEYLNQLALQHTVTRQDKTLEKIKWR